MHHGNVPAPDCLRTLGALGAVASAATAQRGEPLPVTPAAQPGGSSPGVMESKLTKPATRRAAERTVSMDPPIEESSQRLDGTPSWDTGSLRPRWESPSSYAS